MLTDEEIQEIRNRAKLNDNRQIDPMSFARDIERAVLAKALAQQERVHKEWSELWTPIDDLVRPLTPLGGSVASKAVELISLGLAKTVEQDPIGKICKSAECGGVDFYFDKIPDGETMLYAHPPPAQAIPEGYTAIKTDVFNWLLGENGDFECPKSQYFRDKPAKYFWRTNLRNSVLSASPKP